MDYRYRSPIGTFLIRQRQDSEAELLVDGILLGGYDSIESAWEDVARQSTGWDEWDRLAQADIPDLDKWEVLPETSRH